MVKVHYTIKRNILDHNELYIADVENSHYKCQSAVFVPPGSIFMLKDLSQ